MATLSSNGDNLIPEDITQKQKVFLKLGKDHVVLEPLSEDPVEHFCGIYKEGSSLTKALLKERKADKRREEKK